MSSASSSLPRTRAFLARWVVFGALQAGLFWGVYDACPSRFDHYASASVDKQARLAEVDGPRLILVGGSNVAFGHHSPRFRELGLEPVNMGLNVALGLDYLVREAIYDLREGDVVLVSAEYALYWSVYNRDELWSLLEHNPAAGCRFGPDHVQGSLDHGFIFLSRKLHCALTERSTDSDRPKLYSRSAFNEEGDFVAHYGRETRFDHPLSEVKDGSEPTDYTRGLDAIRRLHEACTERGARCFLTFPPLRTRAYEAGKQSIAKLEETLRTRSPLPVLGRPADMVSSPEDFFDSGYHLNEQGSAKRTELLLQLLKSALGS